MKLVQGYISPQLLEDLKAHSETLDQRAGDAFIQTYVQRSAAGSTPSAREPVRRPKAATAVKASRAKKVAKAPRAAKAVASVPAKRGPGRPHKMPVEAAPAKNKPGRRPAVAAAANGKGKPGRKPRAIKGVRTATVRKTRVTRVVAAEQ
jgi:hypothetical protein